MRSASLRRQQQHWQLGFHVPNPIAQTEALAVSLGVRENYAIHVDPSEDSQSMLCRNRGNHFTTGLFQDARNMPESLPTIHK